MIELDSTPSNGCRDVAQFAAELCQSAGLFVEIQSESHNGLDQANVIARPIGFRPEGELLLQTHLDTPDPGNYALWTKTGANPFNASIYTDTLFGLGTASSKLDFVCKLRAASEIKTASWKLPYALVGTFGEEVGMSGAIKLIRKKRVSAKVALVGEPTEMRLVTAGKGFAGVEIEIPFSEEEVEFRARHDSSDGSTTQSRVFVGKAAHSSVPQLGESAIKKLLDYLTKLPEGIAIMEIEGGTSYNTVPAHAFLEIDMVGELKESIAAKIAIVARAIHEVENKFEGFPDPTFTPPFPSLNIGMIRTYQDHVKFGGSCRLPPTVSDEVYEEWMSILRRACQSVGAIFRVTDYKQPFRTSEEESIVKVCRDQLLAMGRQTECATQAVANEANVFSRFGISCVAIGPGKGVGNSHAPNECVKIEELHEAVRFYKGILERVCL